MTQYESVVEEPDPLWLPKGSVRSLMALAILGVALFMWIDGREMQPTQELITGGVVGAYFVQRAATTSAANARRDAVRILREGVSLDDVDLLKRTPRAPTPPPVELRPGVGSVRGAGLP